MNRIVLFALATSGLVLAAPALPHSGDRPMCADRLAGQARQFTIAASGAESRPIPLTVYAPEAPGRYPLIAFSHGAFAAPDRYSAMLEPLAAAGYIVLAPMHIDSEDYPRQSGDPERPPHPITWSTRNEDFELALDPDQRILEGLAREGLAPDRERRIALGHSYGALIAQLPGGAMASEPDGTQVRRADPGLDAVIGWSPPGAMPGLMTNEGWASLAAPTLTITGTADILPGFIADWEAHKASYVHAPKGARALWVGEGIDHYFGGMFGREKPASERERALFGRALATTLHFIETRTGLSRPCRLGDAAAGELYEED